MKIHFPNLDFWFLVTKALSGFGTPVIFFGSLGLTRSLNFSFFAADLIVSFTIWCKYPRSFFSLIGLVEHCLVTLENITLKCSPLCPVVACSKEMCQVEIHNSKLTASEHHNLRKMLSFRSPFIIKGMVSFQNYRTG